MADHIIVGAGASGLYTAYRLLKDGALPPGDTVRVYEWSQRPGGRIYTYTFPEDVGGDGLYCEFGGMRFATDPHFPESTADGHRIVQSLIIDLGLAGRVVPFGKSENRLYYLRGLNVYEDDLLTLRKLKKLPYRFNTEFLKFLKKNKVAGPFTADTIIGAIAGVFAPGLGGSNEDRPPGASTSPTARCPRPAPRPAFPPGRPRATSATGTCSTISWGTRATTTRPTATATRPTSSTGARPTRSRTTTTSAPRPATCAWTAATASSSRRWPGRSASWRRRTRARASSTASSWPR